MAGTAGFMAIFNRCASFARLLALLLVCGNLSLAQDSGGIRAVGSATANALLEQLATASGAQLDISTTGSARGLDIFCNGDIDLATSARQMSSAESLICESNEVSYSELLLGHQIAAIVSHVDAPQACLSAADLDELFKPTSSNQGLDWSFVNPDQAELPLTLLLPPPDDIAYAIIDGQVVGDGLRLDGEMLAADEAVARVAETPGALAILPWTESLADIESLRVMELRDAASGTCLVPSVDAVENQQYAAAQSLYIYVNRARLDSSDALLQFMEFAADESRADLVSAAGITPPSSAISQLNADLLANADALPLLSGDASAYRIPPSLIGTVRVAGAANAYNLLNSAGEQLTRAHPQLLVEFDMAGGRAGLASLCADEADIALLDAQLPLDDCDAAGVTTLPFTIGAQATVLLGNAGDDYAACLTTEQIAAAWRADSSETVSSWSDIDESFPQTDMTLFGLFSLDTHTDILLQAADGIIPPLRRDTEQDYDASYRAAAVANVPGALTYMTWNDYQIVLEKEQANARAVAVDGGAGCIEPTLATIRDGSYALTRPASILAREAALSDKTVQSLLWTLYTDEQWSQVTRAGFIGATSLELPAIRRDLQAAFLTAEANFAQLDSGADADANESESE